MNNILGVTDRSKIKGRVIGVTLFSLFATIAGMTWLKLKLKSTAAVFGIAALVVFVVLAKKVKDNEYLAGDFVFKDDLFAYAGIIATSVLTISNLFLIIEIMRSLKLKDAGEILIAAFVVYSILGFLFYLGTELAVMVGRRLKTNSESTTI